MQMTDLASNPDLKVVAFVHAKGTSERLPGKNLRVLGDRPLICHAIANALAAATVDAVVIDSDSDEILRVGEGAGAVPLKRPADLASNRTTGDDLAYWQATNVPRAETIVQVVPTSPFIGAATIDEVTDHFLKWRHFDSLAGLFHDRVYQWNDGKPSYGQPIPNSQDAEWISYETTGLYLFRQRYACEHKRRVSHIEDTRGQWNLTRIEAIDINTKEDFEFAEIVWKGLQC